MALVAGMVLSRPRVVVDAGLEPLVLGRLSVPSVKGRVFLLVVVVARARSGALGAWKSGGLVGQSAFVAISCSGRGLVLAGSGHSIVDLLASSFVSDLGLSA